MKAMILAAGLGTRLEPLTKTRPKPLFPVLNKPLLGIIIGQLGSMGATGVIINAHHLAEQVEQVVDKGDWGLQVEVRVEPNILGTGGGIKNCADFLQDAPFFVVVNADVYHTFDLAFIGWIVLRRYMPGAVFSIKNDWIVCFNDFNF